MSLAGTRPLFTIMLICALVDYVILRKYSPGMKGGKS